MLSLLWDPAHTCTHYNIAAHFQQRHGRGAHGRQQNRDQADRTANPQTYRLIAEYNHVLARVHRNGPKQQIGPFDRHDISINPCLPTWVPRVSQNQVAWGSQTHSDLNAFGLVPYDPSRATDIGEVRTVCLALITGDPAISHQYDVTNRIKGGLPHQCQRFLVVSDCHCGGDKCPRQCIEILVDFNIARMGQAETSLIGDHERLKRSCTLIDKTQATYNQLTFWHSRLDTN